MCLKLSGLPARMTQTKMSNKSRWPALYWPRWTWFRHIPSGLCGEGKHRHVVASLTCQPALGSVFEILGLRTTQSKSKMGIQIVLRSNPASMILTASPIDCWKGLVAYLICLKICKRVLYFAYRYFSSENCKSSNFLLLLVSETFLVTKICRLMP